MAGASASEPAQRFTTPIVLSIAAVAMAAVAVLGQPGSVDGWTVAALVAGLVPWALIAAGHRVPMVVFIGVSIAVGFVIVVGQSNPGGMFPVMLVLVWVALHTDDLRLMVGSLVASAVPMVLVTITDGGLDENGTVYMLSGLGFSWLTGRLLRRQQKLTAELQAMQELRVEHAAAEERTHIAREVHDVVAHSLTVVMLHLTGARRALASDPERAGEALARAEHVGRESLDSVRQVVGLLRRADDGSRELPAPPQPSVADVAQLVEGYRVGGLDVSTNIELDGVDLDPGTQLVVYRLVQESLSNALQHAPGASCTVEIASHEGHEALAIAGQRVLDVAVVNSAPRGTVAPSTATADRDGLGLRGMRERVRATGGRFEAGPRADGGWRVQATLPLRNATAREVTWPPVPTTP